MPRARPPRGEPAKKFDRPLEEIAHAFRPQYAPDDCTVVCLDGIVREFAKRRGFEFQHGRDTLKQICGYRGTFGSTSTKIVPNLNVAFRNNRLGNDLAARESQGSASTRDLLEKMCTSELTSFPIIGVSKNYWKAQTHLQVRTQAELDHTLIVLAANKEAIRYYDPYQRPAPPGVARETVHQMPTVTFLKLWQEALMAPAWLLWIAQTRERPPLEAFGKEAPP
jgi:hypothetical protein